MENLAFIYPKFDPEVEVVPLQIPLQLVRLRKNLNGLCNELTEKILDGALGLNQELKNTQKSIEDLHAAFNHQAE